MIRRIVGFGALAGLALVWRGPPTTLRGLVAWLLLAACAFFLARSHADGAMVTLLGLAALAILDRPDSALDWRVWTLGALFGIAFGTTTGNLPTRGGYARTGLVISGLALLAVIAYVWRPTHDALQGESGVTFVVLVTAAAGVTLALLVVEEGKRDGET